jgi:hypothetical protein
MNELSEFEVYKGKPFSSLCKEIVTNQNQKKDQLDVLVSELRGLIKTVNDAMMIVPMIKDYLDVGVKNDEQLIKLAAIVQRIMSKQTDGSGEESPFVITDEEKKQLLSEIKNLENESVEIKVSEIK